MENSHATDYNRKCRNAHSWKGKSQCFEDVPRWPVVGRFCYFSSFTFHEIFNCAKSGPQPQTSQVLFIHILWYRCTHTHREREIYIYIDNRYILWNQHLGNQAQKNDWWTTSLVAVQRALYGQAVAEIMGPKGGVWNLAFGGLLNTNRSCSISAAKTHTLVTLVHVLLDDWQCKLAAAHVHDTSRAHTVEGWNATFFRGSFPGPCLRWNWFRKPSTKHETTYRRISPLRRVEVFYCPILYRPLCQRSHQIKTSSHVQA